MSDEQKRYRAWFIANPPGAPWTFETDNIRDAQTALDAVTQFALHLGDGMIPVSVGGVQRWNETLDDWYDFDGDEMYCRVCGLDRDGDYIWGDPDNPTVEPMHPDAAGLGGQHDFIPTLVIVD